jgi:hypothetical protein
MIAKKYKILNFEKESTLFVHYFNWNHIDSDWNFLVDKCIWRKQ